MRLISCLLKVANEGGHLAIFDSILVWCGFRCFNLKYVLSPQSSQIASDAPSAAHRTRVAIPRHTSHWAT
jgi:hypothetical protein